MSKATSYKKRSQSLQIGVFYINKDKLICGVGHDNVSKELLVFIASFANLGICINALSRNK